MNTCRNGHPRTAQLDSRGFRSCPECKRNREIRAEARRAAEAARVLTFRRRP